MAGGRYAQRTLRCLGVWGGTHSVPYFFGFVMQEKLIIRLNQLRDEYAEGQRVMGELQDKQTGLQQTLLSISGAIQVLEELLREDAPTEHEPQQE